MAQRKIYAKIFIGPVPGLGIRLQAAFGNIFFRFVFPEEGAAKSFTQPEVLRRLHRLGRKAWLVNIVVQCDQMLEKIRLNNIHSSLCKNSPKVTNLFWLLLEAIWFSRTLKNSVLNTNFIPVAPFRLYGCHHVCHFSTFRF